MACQQAQVAHRKRPWSFHIVSLGTRFVSDHCREDELVNPSWIELQNNGSRHPETLCFRRYSRSCIRVALEWDLLGSVGIRCGRPGMSPINVLINTARVFSS
jgi:hypothetical protein